MSALGIGTKQIGNELEYQHRLIIPKIVIVCEQHREAYKRTLSYRPYSISTASNAKEALDIIKKFSIGSSIILITSLALMDSNGIDLALKLVQRNYNCTNILITEEADSTNDKIIKFKEQLQSDRSDCIFASVIQRPISCAMLRNAVLDCISIANDYIDDNVPLVN